MKARTRQFKKHSTREDFWPSFTDVMSSMTIIIFFIMLLAYIQNILTGRNLELSTQDLENTKIWLAQTQKDLELAKTELDDTRNSLDASRAEIFQAEKDLELLQDEVEKTKAEVELGKTQLAISQREIEKQQTIIAESNEELGNLRTKLSHIALLRLDVLEKVKDSIETTIGNTSSTGQELVSIGENANIIINESLVFDYNAYNIKEEGKELLRQLAIAFEKILDDREIRENIDCINIEGHTDDVGSAEYNRELSAKRAASVVDYLMQSNPRLESKYSSYFAASGFSKFRPISQGTDSASRAKNRRIEIAVIVKDQNISKIISEYLN